MNEEIRLTAREIVTTISPLPLTIPIIHLFLGRFDIVEDGLQGTYIDPKTDDLVFVYKEIL